MKKLGLILTVLSIILVSCGEIDVSNETDSGITKAVATGSLLNNALGKNGKEWLAETKLDIKTQQDYLKTLTPGTPAYDAQVASMERQFGGDFIRISNVLYKKDPNKYASLVNESGSIKTLSELTEQDLLTGGKQEPEIIINLELVQ
jgi:hypothetical protein